MLNNFIYSEEKQLFEELLNQGNVSDESIAFIEDTKEIWNRGTYFGGNINLVKEDTNQNLNTNTIKLGPTLHLTSDVINVSPDSTQITVLSTYNDFSLRTNKLYIGTGLILCTNAKSKNNPVIELNNSGLWIDHVQISSLLLSPELDMYNGKQLGLKYSSDFEVNPDEGLCLANNKLKWTNLLSHEAIDLGLPSGTKWASCNVGAESPEEYGGYYAWGEIEEKTNYSWSTYKWCNGSSNTLTKYCTNSSYGTVDNKITLDPEDDVAHVLWGGDWRMPTLDEIKELLDECTWKWTTQNGVKGRKVTGPNGNSIFLPAAGIRNNTSPVGAGSYGYYWSAMTSNNNHYAYYLSFTDFVYSLGTMFGRNLGYTVRPVINLNN